jgi:hypothetical protein
LACRCCYIFEIGTRTVEFTLACAVEAEIRSWTVGGTSKGDIIFVVVYREGRAISDTSSLV